MTGTRFRANQLVGFCSTVYEALGLFAEDAQLLADSLEKMWVREDYSLIYWP